MQGQTGNPSMSLLIIADPAIDGYSMVKAWDLVD